MRTLLSLLAFLLTLPAVAQDQGKLLFQLPSGQYPAYKPVEARDFQIVDGRAGKAIQFGPKGILRFPTDGNLDRSRGTVCLWVKPPWATAEETSHALFSDDREFKNDNNSLTLWEWHTGLLRFDVRDKSDQYLTTDVKGWKPGEWHHVAAAWDCNVGTFLFADGELKATKKLTWTPKPSESFQFGCARGGQHPANAQIEDVRIYNCVLTSGQVRRVMSGKKIQGVAYAGIEAPDEIETGKEFEVSLSFTATEALEDGYTLVALLDGCQIASAPLTLDSSQRTHQAKIAALVPEYLCPSPGRRKFRAELSGAFGIHMEKAGKEVLLKPRNLPPAPKTLSEAQQNMANARADAPALLPDGNVVTPDKAAQNLDAIPVRLVDEVDCAATDHGYRENSPATVEDINGVKFRCVGPQEKVTETKKRDKTEVKALAAFSYRLKVMPRPTPHLVVVESVNDAERYLEVAIDHPRDSAIAPHLAASGLGDPSCIHLSVTYSGRECATDGKTYRQAFMLFPKTDAVEVMFSGTARANWPEAKPAAVSHIWVYEIPAPFADLANPVFVPEGQPQRTVSIFFPAINLIFEKYGFSDSGAGARASTLRLFMDYMRFMGLNRFELRPFHLSSKCCFKCKGFEQAGDLDFFAEALPIMREAGVTCVPRVMYLHCYHKLLEDDQDNFQWASTGKIMGFGREGPLPDPLRPPVQKIVLDSLNAMIEACKGFDNVPAIGFDTSIGGLYGWEFKDSTSLTGYSKWDIEQFAKDTGTKVPETLDTPGKRYEWLKANCWNPWIAWRCESWHRFVTRMRDLAKANGKKLELSLRIMPRQEFETERVPIKDIYRQTGFDPDLFRGDEDIQMDYFIRINSDRYFGRPWWKPWFYDPQQPELFVSREPRHAELYFNYWEIPSHPWGFRVGPGSPAGRSFFEPITYLMRKFSPHDLTFFNWFAGTIGREFEVREFCRAFRALPAVEPKDFDGEIVPKPADDRLWVKWFGDRLCVVNDSPKEQEITLLLPPKEGRVLDATLGRFAETTGEAGHLSLKVGLRAYDLRTFIFMP